jgi:hypothetical protein
MSTKRDRYQEHLEERRAQRYASTRLWNEDPDKIGMWGEKTLADFFGAEQDLRNRPEGDDGIDLETLLHFDPEPKQWFELDVKTARAPKNLLVNTKTIKPHRLYLLAAAAGPATQLRGWEYGHKLMLCPTEWWSGNDALVHYKSSHLLQPMSNLKEAYCGWWRHHGLEPHQAKAPPPQQAAPPPSPSIIDTGPDLQQWIEKYGGYSNIDWAAWDVAVADFQARRRDRSQTR